MKGHSGRGVGGYRADRHGGPPPLPDPEDAETIGDDEWAALTDGATWAEPAPQLAQGGSAGPGAPEDIPASPEGFSGPRDEPPAHAEPGWAAEPRGGAPVKVTAAVRRSITAKIRLPVSAIGAIWEIRDPICGGAWRAQEREIAEAWAAIVCDSPQLVAFFEGPAGGYMKWFGVGFAMWPVASVVIAHHVVHSIPAEDQAGPDAYRHMPEPDPARYPG